MSKKKKILIITTSIKTFNYILKDQPAFLNDYLKVCIGSSNLKELKKYANSQGLDYFALPLKRGIAPFHDIMAIISLIFILIKQKPNILHSYTPKAGLICAISGFICRTPNRIHTFTGLIFPSRNGLLRRILSFADSLICFLNNQVLAEGAGVKSQLMQYNITKKSIGIIGNGNIAGCDTTFFNTNDNLNREVRSLKTKFKINDQTISFIFVGRINEDKGIVELIHSFNEIESVNVRLIILGDIDSEKLKKYFLYSVDNNCNIFYESFKKDIRPFLQISDCLVLPSYREGFPNVLLQAGAMRLPCIVTDIPGSNEIIMNEVNGWLCEAKSVSQLQKLMKFFITLKKQRRKEIGTVARKNIKTNYEQIEFRKKLRKFYEDL